MLFEQALFFVAAALAIAGALGVVLLRNPFYSVLALVVHLISLAILFLLLHAEFVAAAQVVVYAGAVMVLYVFVVAYVGGADEPLGPTGAATRAGPLFAGVLLVEVAVAVIGSGLSGLDSRGAEVGPGFGSPGQVGELLLRKFLLPFELASLLLLVAAVAAVLLTRRRRGLELVDRALEDAGPRGMEGGQAAAGDPAPGAGGRLRGTRPPAAGEGGVV